MARKLITDAIFVSQTVALAALNEARANVSEALNIDIANILRDNLPTITEQDETGADAIYPIYGVDENTGEIVFDPSAKDAIGTLALVTIYEGEITPPEGEPIANPVAVYLLNLPKQSEILADAKLSQYRETLIAKDLLLRARKLAKADYAGTTSLVRDRIASLIAAAARAGASAGKAYDAIFPILQGVILNNIAKKVEAAQAAGQHAQARMIRDTFSKARLNKDVLRECLSSTAGAKVHFPAMPQAQWETLLRFGISWAPKHQVARPVKDEAGNNVKEITEDGKERVVRELKPMPQSPAIFQQWLDTRDEAAAVEQGFEIDLSDMTVTLPGQAAA